MLAAAAEAASTIDAGPWLARNVWIIVLLPIISFVLTLFFGKRTPGRGQYIGLAAMVASLLLSVVLAVQWMGRGHVALEEGSKPAVAATARGFEAPELAHGGGHGADGHAAGKALPVVEDAGGGGAVEHHAIDVRPYVENEVRWFSSGKIDIDVGTRVDGFAIVMLFTVALISFLVHLFSTSYMEDDERRTHYFAALGLFTAGMFILVTASSGLLMLVGWEIMGLCSFMLIGHWWEEKKNTDAALKAFLTTRTGDIGLLVGLSIMFFAAGQTFNMGRWNQLAAADQLPHTLVLLAAIALFVACIGKSAQFPLHTWLPDAMAGPTPASSLIHAATMVVAGVYMVGRLYPIFFTAFDIKAGGLNPIAVIGATTILIAGGLAFVQTDIKKVLAYSTVSQLGYMVMGLGVGAWTGAIFHLFTHAFFKCLLFQGAGAISHSCYHSFEMEDYGGLRKLLPRTTLTFGIGTLALMGLPIFAGFWSKDEILLGAWSNGTESGYKLFFWVGCIGAAMTCGYMTRVWFKTFEGEHHGPQSENAKHHAHHGAHGDDGHGAAETGVHGEVHDPAGTHPVDAHATAGGHGADAHGWGLHESPAPMMIPLYVLAAMSVLAGLINVPGLLAFTHYTAIESVVAAGAPEPHFSATVAIISTLIGLAGLALSFAYQRGMLPFLHGLTGRNRVARGGYRFLQNKYYLDTIYERGVVRGIKQPVSNAAYWFNQRVLDGAVNGVGTSAKATAQFVYDNVDQGVVDGAVNGSGRGATGLGRAFAFVASGKVQQYAAILFGGAAFGAVILAFIN